MAKLVEKSNDSILKGWNAIAKFLGQTVAVAQRWHRSGMPVNKEGRSIIADREVLTKWVGTEMGKKEPVHIASEDEDLMADLRRGLSYVRKMQDSGGRDVSSQVRPRRQI